MAVAVPSGWFTDVSRPRLLAAVAARTSDDVRNAAARYADMPPLWRPWQLIAGNTFDHHPEHIPAIRAWLNRGKV